MFISDFEEWKASLERNEYISCKSTHKIRHNTKYGLYTCSQFNTQEDAIRCPSSIEVRIVNEMLTCKHFVYHLCDVNNSITPSSALNGMFSSILHLKICLVKE